MKLQCTASPRGIGDGWASMRACTDWARRRRGTLAFLGEIKAGHVFPGPAGLNWDVISTTPLALQCQCRSETRGRD